MQLNHTQLSPTPPMGWNSWDCFGTTVNEEQVRANADYMAEFLLVFGWNYIVIDIHWYEPNPMDYSYPDGKTMVMDKWGRLMPEEIRFPSAKNGKGFKPLADYIHSKGLKFGIHILRGIPRQAVKNNCPILNTNSKAANIANQNDRCSWNPTMFGVDMSINGSQEYYDSLFELYALWGVDFVKVDDLGQPYHHLEAEAIRKAIDKCGRPMVFSVSPGPALLENAVHLASNTNMWRISGDFWDNWIQLRHHFDLCAKWALFLNKIPGTWPDADMLPLGKIHMVSTKQILRGKCFLTHNEQLTLMNLFVMFRSPLFYGGHLPGTDQFTLDLLTNKELLHIHQSSKNNRCLFTNKSISVWIAEDINSTDIFLAVFNLAGWKRLRIKIEDLNLELSGNYQIRDIWLHQDIGEYSQGSNPNFKIVLKPHASVLYRLKFLN